MAKYNKADRPPVTIEECAEIARLLCERTFAEPELARKLQAGKIIIQFRYNDPEYWDEGAELLVTIDASKDPVDVVIGPTDIKPELVMTMESFTAHLFWMEKINLMSALTRGLMKAKGPIPKAMRLLPALKPLYRNYRIILAELGMNDLLNFPPD